MAMMPYRYGMGFGADDDLYGRQRQLAAQRYGAAGRYGDPASLPTLSADSAEAGPAPAADAGSWLGAMDASMGRGGMAGAASDFARGAEAAPRSDWLGAVSAARDSFGGGGRSSWGAPADRGGFMSELGRRANAMSDYGAGRGLAAAADRGAENQMAQQRQAAQQPMQQPRSRFQYGQAPPMMRRQRPMPRFGPPSRMTGAADSMQAQRLKPALTQTA